MLTTTLPPARPLSMAVEHYENFPVASWLLPRPLRAPVVAIYWFARTADDIADEGSAPDAARLAQLATYQEGLDQIRADGRTGPGFPETLRPIFDPLGQAVREHQLDTAPLYRLLAAFRQDVQTKSYPTYQELQQYCHLSANPIGELLLALYNVDDPARLEESNAVCTGLQLTNFWQDVALDWEKGRVYLPEEELQTFGVSRSQIEHGRVDERWRSLMAFQVQRARALLHSGMALCQHLPTRLGLELKVVVHGGLRILELLEKAGYNMFQSRPRLVLQDRAVVLARSLLPRRA